MKLFTRLLPFTALLPMFAFAQTANFSYLQSLVTAISGLVDTLIPLLFAVALLFFLWGVFQYFIFGAGDEEKRETAKKFMIYALVGLVLMVAVWGIVKLIASILGVNISDTVNVTKKPIGNP